MAYQTRQFDLSRVPDSLRSERFDIIGKASSRISGDEYWSMLQLLLEDRFKLAWHRETREAQFFALVVDGKVSAKRGGDVGPALGRSSNADCPENPDGRNYCGVSPVPGRMIGQRIPMARIARELSPFARRPVLDETGLTGALPSHPTEHPEQLGLKLEAKKGPIEILVIDRARQPGKN